MHLNREHPANGQENFKITIEPIEHGAECGFMVYLAGHGGTQRTFAANRAEVKDRIGDALEDWEKYQVGRIDSAKLETTTIKGVVDLPA